jgi:ParB-like chromosome segregation protein Spo0J
MKSVAIDTTVEVRMMPIKRLKPAPYNPRRVLKPADTAYRKLEASLRQFGLVEPLIWNERTGHVVGGHTRLGILKKLGVKQVPVSVVQLSDEREKALNVVLNNQEAQGRYDPEKLADLLEELDELPELVMTGFDHHTVETLRFEPVADRDEPEETEARVVITLEMDAAIYERAAPKLDALIAEFDLISHVRRSA